MTVDAKAAMTTDEYLSAERAAETRSEFRDGQMVAMPGGSYQHSLIAANLIYAIRKQLRSGPCRILGSDMRIAAPAASLYTYADVVVVRGKPELADRYRDTLLNPEVIIEVLSPSTETYDRGRKFQYYMTLTSLREYLLISQDRPRVEHYSRQDKEDAWIFTTVTGPAAIVEMPSIGCAVPLAEIYNQVPFEI